MRAFYGDVREEGRKGREAKRRAFCPFTLIFFECTELCARGYACVVCESLFVERVSAEDYSWMEKAL